MELLGSKERKTQIYFQDDNKFRFIKRRLAFSCLIEKAKIEEGKSWKHSHSTQKYFPGYKNISADTITLGFARDIILDPFNEIPIGEGVSEKPKPNDKLSLKRWIARTAENQRHYYRSHRKKSFKEDFVNYCLMGVLMLMTVAWLVSFLKGLYS